ncbi:uncharacterized protein EI97DRAFT_386222 [Westerdykella ornata]|uniref:CAP20-like protein n=1 Tax=Westerdykella ornata TaxID=318751 RepID=A0A6A6J6L0_WESOR|nr:uncharacterized protein EI97DRAFT_386222 [Westerdykella ornata]KAF2272211.1 hypothetical protein EI97DRAFT_386222 [Westerdykella ornata]
MVNGEQYPSKVLSHLDSYPLIHDTVTYAKSSPYGSKSLSLLASTYQRLVSPLTPYLATPYSYVAPYLYRADDLGDASLTNLDSRFPIVKEDTEKLKEHVQEIALAPIALIDHGKRYVVGTWRDEYSKTGGQEGVVKSVKALISTELKMGLDGYRFLSERWERKKEASRKSTQSAGQSEKH